MPSPTQTPPERGREIPFEPANGAPIGGETTAFDNGTPPKKRSIAVPAILGVVALLAIGLFIKNRSSNTATTDASAQAATRLTTVRVVPVTTGTIVETLPLTGQLKSNQDVNINSKISGQVQRVYVNEGQRVSRGQLLVQLDTGDLSQQVNAAQANLESARVKLQQAQVGLPASIAQINNAVREAQAQLNTAQANYQQALLSEPTKTTNARSQVESARAAVQSSKARVAQARNTAKQTEGQVNGGIRAAQAALEQARAQLEQTRNGSRNQQIAQAQAQVDLAQAQLDNAQTNLRRQTMLYEGGATAKANVDTAQTSRDVAAAQLESAKQNLLAIQQGAYNDQVRAAEQVVVQREAALSQAQAQSSGILAAQAQVTDALGAQAQAEQGLQQAIANLSQIPITQQDTVAAKQAVDQARAQLQTAQANRAQIPVQRANVPAAQAAVDNAQSQLDQANLNLQYASIKSPVSGVVNTKSIDAGETVSPGATLLNVVSTSNVIFEAQIPASQLDQIQVGQPARISVSSIAGGPIIGYVTDIIPVADVRLRQFRVRISLPEDRRLTPGAFAQGTLQTQVSKDTLVVPDEDVRTDASAPYVYVAVPDGDNAEIKKRTVKVGGTANGRTQILAGLNEGDRVIQGTGLYEDGQNVKIAQEK